MPGIKSFIQSLACHPFDYIVLWWLVGEIWVLFGLEMDTKRVNIGATTFPAFIQLIIDIRSFISTQLHAFQVVFESCISCKVVKSIVVCNRGLRPWNAIEYARINNYIYISKCAISNRFKGFLIINSTYWNCNKGWW